MMFLKLELTQQKSNHGELSTPMRYILGLVIGVLSVALMFAVTNANRAAPVLADQVVKHLALSGVENPVTAVLLNFRSYDTLLEIAVLLIVAMAILPDQLSTVSNSETNITSFITVNNYNDVNPMLISLLSWLVPVAIIVAGYLLWTGAYSPGGAFQAGAVIAGAGVALSLAGRHQFGWQTRSARVALSAGLLIFLLAAAFSAVITGTTLQYPANYAGSLILVVEIAATLSIAAILLLLFVQLKALIDQWEKRSQ